MPERAARMTNDAVADAAFIYLADPIEPGAAVSCSTLNRYLDRGRQRLVPRRGRLYAANVRDLCWRIDTAKSHAV